MQPSIRSFGARERGARQGARCGAWQLAYAWNKFVQQCPEQDGAMQAFVNDAAYPHTQARSSLLTVLEPEVVQRRGWDVTLGGIVRDAAAPPPVREAAAGAMWKLPKEHLPETTKVLRAALLDQESLVAARAAKVATTAPTDSLAAKKAAKLVAAWGTAEK